MVGARISGSSGQRQRYVIADSTAIRQKQYHRGLKTINDGVDQSLLGLINFLQVTPTDMQIIWCHKNATVQQTHSDTAPNAATRAGLRSLTENQQVTQRGVHEISVFIAGEYGNAFCIYLPIEPTISWSGYASLLTPPGTFPLLEGWELFRVVQPPYTYCLLHAGALHAGSESMHPRLFYFLQTSARTRSGNISGYTGGAHKIRDENQSARFQVSTELRNVKDR
jgi:hypothetical protein